MPIVINGLYCKFRPRHYPEFSHIWSHIVVSYIGRSKVTFITNQLHVYTGIQIVVTWTQSDHLKGIRKIMCHFTSTLFVAPFNWSSSTIPRLTIQLITPQSYNMFCLCHSSVDALCHFSTMLNTPTQVKKTRKMVSVSNNFRLQYILYLWKRVDYTHCPQWWQAKQFVRYPFTHLSQVYQWSKTRAERLQRVTDRIWLSV